MAGLSLLLFLGIICGATVHVGATVMTGRPWDVPMFLDGAWRVTHGQIPHSDFYLHLGSVILYVTALGMYLGGPSVSAIAYGNVIFCLFISGLTFYILSRRTSAFNAALWSIFLGMLIIATRPIGDPYYRNDYAMLYNRYGEALVSVLIVKAFLDVTNRRRYLDVIDDCIEGVILALLLYCKVSYFVVGVVVVASSAFLSERRISSLVVGTFSFVVWSTAFVILTGIMPYEMWEDMVIVFNAQDGSGRLRTAMIKTAIFSGTMLVLLIPVCEYIAGLKRQGYQRFEIWREVFIVGVIAASGIAILSSNTQKNEIPLLATSSFIFLDKIRRQNRNIGTDSNNILSYRYVGCFLIMLFFVLPTLAADTASVRHSLSLSRRARGIERIDSPQMKDFMLFVDEERIKGYHMRLVDGMELLQRHISDSTRVLSIGFTDPFAFALGLPPPNGGAICWAINSTFSGNAYPPPEKVLNGADLVLVRRERNVLDEVPIYREFIDEAFRKIDETEHWMLFKRRGEWENGVWS